MTIKLIRWVEKIKAVLSQALRRAKLLTVDTVRRRRQRLLRFILFEKLASFFEVERVPVDDQLVFAGVFRDGDDALDTMAVLAEGLNDEIDVYHA